MDRGKIPEAFLDKLYKDEPVHYIIFGEVVN